MHSNLYDELWGRINQYSDATLLTLEVDGTLRSDHLEALRPEYDGSIWFFAAASRPFLRNIEASAEICINYSDADHYELASLCGSAEVIRDPAIKQAKWAVMSALRLSDVRSWQEGSLVRVAIDYAEYWDPYGNHLSRFSAPPQSYSERRSERFGRGGLNVSLGTPQDALGNG